MVLLEDVVHLGHVLAADGLDDVALVVRRVEAGAAPSLGLAVQGGAARQGVLWTQSQRQRFKGVGWEGVRWDNARAWSALYTSFST